MKSIIVLVDYTEGCKLALQQAKVLAVKSGASITVLHQLNEADPRTEDIEDLRAFANAQLLPEVTPLVHVTDGKLIESLSDAIVDLKPDLVVVCTHGVKGLSQHLFGARILKLLQSFHCASLVVQENTRVRDLGIRRILFPASPFPDVHQKIRHTAKVAKALGAEVVLYEIEKYLGDHDEVIRENLQAAEDHFNENGVKYSRVLEPNKTASLGYSRQTIQYASQNGIDAVSITTEIQDHDLAILKADKEAMLTNDLGVPMLCCPSH